MTLSCLEQTDLTSMKKSVSWKKYICILRMSICISAIGLRSSLQQGDRRQLTAVHSLTSSCRVVQLVKIPQEDWGYLTIVLSRWWTDCVCIHRCASLFLNCLLSPTKWSLTQWGSAFVLQGNLLFQKLVHLWCIIWLIKILTFVASFSCSF